MSMSGFWTMQSATWCVLISLSRPASLMRIRWLAENVENARLETVTGEFAGFHKLRIGDYQVVYLMLHGEQTLVVNAVGHR